MKIFNTMTKKKEEFVPLEKGKDVCMRTYRIQFHPHR